MPFILLTLLIQFCFADVPIIERVKKNPRFVDASEFPNVQLDVRYATEANFLRRPIYKGYKYCFLHKEAAEMFKQAIRNLQATKPGFKFLVFDCLRPRSIQREMWALVKDTPKRKYVADPEVGSVHNYGFAIDLSLVDANGKEVDMGTPYDFFGKLAETNDEDQAVKQGQLTKAQLMNRKILREAMTKAGFIQLPHEWWHYDGLTRKDLQGKYEIFE